MVKSERVYSPQNYVCAVTGTYYLFNHKTHPVEEIHEIIKAHQCDFDDCLPWDYPLTEIDHIVENNLDVVLVDCSHYEGDEYINEYRWFEVPEDFKEEQI